MGADMIVVRHPSPGAAHRLAHAGWLDSRVLNAGDGKHEHPTQALADALTIRAHLRPDAVDFEGLTVGIVGDVLHSRVARSNIFLLASLGANVVVIGPPTLLPVRIENWPCTVSYSLDAALPELDVIMMLRVQQERMNGTFFPSELEYSRSFGLNRSRAAALPTHAIVMHPGPMNRGVEITAEVADGARSVITEQVANGLKVRMAIMYLLIGGDVSVT
jgi:aspartate carbamoyltransferase catalytic subunit